MDTDEESAHIFTHAEKQSRLERVYTLSGKYRYDYFDKDFEPWHLVTTGLKRDFNQTTAIARINYAYRFEQEGYQFELDGYPKFSDKSYAYLNMGYSIDDIFPDFRTAVSYYHGLPYNLEGEAGFMYLLFPQQDVLMYTASLSWYVGKYYLSIKPYYAPTLEEGQSFSTLLTIRRYIQSTDLYATLRAGFGSGASGFNYAQDITRLNSQQANLSLFWQMNPVWAMRAELGFHRDEYTEGEFRSRYQGGLGFEFNF